MPFGKMRIVRRIVGIYLYASTHFLEKILLFLYRCLLTCDSLDPDNCVCGHCRGNYSPIIRVLFKIRNLYYIIGLEVIYRSVQEIFVNLKPRRDYSYQFSGKLNNTLK